MNSAHLPLVGLMLCLAAPLWAGERSDLEGEKILADFAQCLVRAAPRDAQMLIDSTPDSEGEKSQFDILFRKHGGCLNFGPSIQDRQLAAEVSLGRTSLSQALSQSSRERRQMNFPGRALRGAIAQRLYLGMPASKFSASALPGRVDDHDALLPVGYRVVLCATAQDPVSADRLVRSKRLSQEEADASHVFAPALNNCARGKGRVDISGTAIHGWAAEALYKQRRLDVLGGR